MASAIIEQEVNYLFNPRHPDFPKISIGKPEDFEFDFRLLKWRHDLCLFDPSHKPQRTKS